jgi:hypothetical protein
MLLLWLHGRTSKASPASGIYRVGEEVWRTRSCRSPFTGDAFAPDAWQNLTSIARADLTAPAMRVSPMRRDSPSTAQVSPFPVDLLADSERRAVLR